MSGTFAVSLRKPPVVARTDHDRGGVRARSKSEDDRVGPTHNEDLTEGIAPRRQGRRFASRSTGRQMDVPQFAHRIAHTCASSVWSHTGRLSARGTQVGHPQPKVLGRARATTRVSGDVVCRVRALSKVP